MSGDSSAVVGVMVACLLLISGVAAGPVMAVGNLLDDGDQYHKDEESAPQGWQAGNEGPEISCVPHPPIRITEDEGPGGFILGYDPVSGAPIYRPGSGIIGGIGTQDDPFLLGGWCLKPPPVDLPFFQIGIHISNTTSHVVIQDNEIREFPLKGVEIEYADNVKVTRNRLASNADGMAAENTENLNVASNTFRNIGKNQLLLEGTAKTSVVGNDIEKQIQGPPLPIDSGHKKPPFPPPIDSGHHGPIGIHGMDNLDLTLENNLINGSGTTEVGVWLKDGHGVTLTGNTVSGPTVGLHLQDNLDQWVDENVFFDTLTGVVITSGPEIGGSVVIERNTIEAVPPRILYGIIIQGGQAEVTGNKILNHAFGIHVRDVQRTILLDNEVDGCNSPGTGVTVLSSTDLMVERTKVRGCQDGVFALNTTGLQILANDIGLAEDLEAPTQGVIMKQVEGAELSGNLINDADSALVLEESTRVVAMHNSLFGDTVGASIIDTEEVRFLRNNIVGNEVGLSFVGGADHVVHDNNIHGNDVAGVATDTSQVVDARFNWWGCPDGPHAAGCDFVEGNVDHSDWRTDPVSDAGP